MLILMKLSKTEYPEAMNIIVDCMYCITLYLLTYPLIPSGFAQGGSILHLPLAEVLLQLHETVPVAFFGANK